MFVPSAFTPLTSGLVVWFVALLIPVLHLQYWAVLTPIDLTLVMAPLGTLLLGARRNDALVLVLVFPITFLPVLLRHPKLVGPSVYGLPAFIALATATVVYVLAALSSFQASTGTRRVSEAGDSGARRARVLTASTLVFGAIGLLPLLALHFDRTLRLRLAQTYGEHSDRALVMIGLLLFAAWAFAVVRYLVRDLGAALMSPESAWTEQYRFEGRHLVRPRVRSALMWAVLVGAACGLLLLAVFSAGGEA